MAKSNIRIFGEPKPPQTGQFTSKIVQKPVVKPSPKPAKKSSNS